MQDVGGRDFRIAFLDSTNILLNIFSSFIYIEREYIRRVVCRVQKHNA